MSVTTQSSVLSPHYSFPITHYLTQEKESI